MSNEDFTAQLAQFSSLEQLTNISTKLDTVDSTLESVLNTEVAGLVGREVTAKGNNLYVDGSSCDITYTLADDAQSGSIKIYDADSSLVETLAFEAQEAGKHTLTWDSSAVTSGNYTFEVTASDSSGSAVTVETVISGIVTEVSLSGDSPSITVNGREVALQDILTVKQTETTE